MLQDILLNAAAAAAGGAANNAEALSQMGFSHLIKAMMADPAEFAVSWIVLIILVIMSFGSWWYTVVNAIKNTVVASRADTVVRTF
jgi:biopolymer transport protein ExbB